MNILIKKKRRREMIIGFLAFGSLVEVTCVVWLQIGNRNLPPSPRWLNYQQNDSKFGAFILKFLKLLK